VFGGYGAAYNLMTSVRDANLAELTNTSGGIPARVSIVPGAIAWDECDQCGLLAYAQVRTYLTNQLPLPAATSDGVGSMLGVDFITQIIRCAPDPQGTNLSPSVAALDASARIVLDDSYAIMCSTISALIAARDTTFTIIDFLVNQQIFVGPEGSCVGSELSYTVAFPR
jgi:hypothetical protein